MSDIKRKLHQQSHMVVLVAVAALLLQGLDDFLQWLEPRVLLYT